MFKIFNVFASENSKIVDWNLHLLKSDHKALSIVGRLGIKWPVSDSSLNGEDLNGINMIKPSLTPCVPTVIVHIFYIGLIYQYAFLKLEFPDEAIGISKYF